MTLVHAIRAVTRRYPYRNGPGWLVAASQPFLGSPSPRWVEAPAWGGCPALGLDLSSRWQRKLFFFPEAYARFYYRSQLAALLPLVLRPGAVFLDIGANVGMFSMLASSLVGAEGEVIAFEPEPTCFEALCRSVKLNCLLNVRCLNLALSDRISQMSFNSAGDGRASSLVPEVAGREGRYHAKVSVEVTTLDASLQDTTLDLSRTALVKVDVEGEEERTVGGMVETLARAGFPPVWCEVRGPRGSTRAPSTFGPVNRRLGALGYSPHRFAGSPQPVTEDDVELREDILFRHPARGGWAG